MRQESAQWKAQMEVNRTQQDFNQATVNAQRGQEKLSESLIDTTSALTKATYALSAGQVAIILMVALWRWRCAPRKMVADESKEAS